MAEIRIHIKIHEGREGAPLDKLSEIAEKWDKFLRSLGDDVGLSIGKGELIATNFQSGSVGFDIVHAGEYRSREIRAFNKGMRDVSSYQPRKRKKPNGRYSSKTLLRYAQIADPLDPSEKISLGVYEEGKEKMEECDPLTKRHAIELFGELERVIDYHGTIYGTIHALYKGGSPMYFQLREYLSEALVRCEFNINLYADVVSALDRPTGLVYASGLITANKASREIRQVAIDKIRPAPELTQEEYEKFFGCAPDITGDLSTEEYIDITRAYDEEDN